MDRWSYFDWSDDTVARLRLLYSQGLGFSGIARTLGCTRPSAIAKARRLGITNRKDPIVRSKFKPDDATRAGNQHFRRDFQGLPGFENFGICWEQRWRFGGWSVTGAENWQPKSCQFIEGHFDNGQASDTRMCGFEVLPGRAYCRHHLKICTIDLVPAETTGPPNPLTK